MNPPWRILVSLALVALAPIASPAAVASPAFSLVPPGAPVTPDSTAEVTLAAMNPSSAEATVELPVAFNARLLQEERGTEARLVGRDNAAPARETIAPGRFVQRTYTLTLPAGLRPGPAVLDVTFNDGRRLRTGLEIGPARATARQSVATAHQRPTTGLVRAQPAAAALRQIFADRISPHEPVYFIYGTEAPGAKFQFSFKYRVLDFSTLGPQRMVRTLQFAFTQRSLWDIDGVSSPFFDTSYMPEVIYQALAPAEDEPRGWFSWLGFQAAFKHESNGRDGPLSRSLNTVYARPVFAFGPLDRWHLLVLPEVFTYVSDLDDNSDIDDYRGHGRLHLVFGRDDGPSLMATLWAGRDFARVSAQLDLTVPVRTKLLNFETYLLLQYFNGYGESLLTYREKSEMLRLGFSLVR